MSQGAVRATYAVLMALVGATTFSALSASAQDAKARGSAKIEMASDALKPGDWVWTPGVAPAGPMLIYVDLSRQIATVYRNGVRIGVTTISSGKKGHSTPTGAFTILERASVHHSSKYHEASMPFTERLTWDGVALHAGGVPGYPESHGCIHLPYGFAKALFSATHRGVPVVVAGNAAKRPPTDESTLLEPTDLTKTGDGPLALDGATFSWTPALSPLGPLTIVISRLDQTIVVLRNGVEIGRGAAQIDDDEDDPGSHVLTLTDWPDSRPRFVYVAVPGHEDDVGKVFDEAMLDRVHLDKAFLKVVRAQLKPGTTVLITDASVGADPDKRITVTDAVPATFLASNPPPANGRAFGSDGQRASTALPPSTPSATVRKHS